jgi:hypothetical protein
MKLVCCSRYIVIAIAARPIEATWYLLQIEHLDLVSAKCRLTSEVPFQAGADEGFPRTMSRAVVSFCKVLVARPRAGPRVAAIYSYGPESTSATKTWAVAERNTRRVLDAEPLGLLAGRDRTGSGLPKPEVDCEE